MRIVKGKIPSEVRKELMQAVKNNELGHIKKDGLLPEIFFHPDQLHTAKEKRKSEAEYAIKRIKSVVG